MNTDERRCPDSLTDRVTGAILEVSNTLGAGFLEKVYERALLRELGLRGIRATAQALFVIGYKGQNIGEYYSDILVEDVLVIELKCVERLANEHLAQCLTTCEPPGEASASSSISKDPKPNGGGSSAGIKLRRPLKHHQY